MTTDQHTSVPTSPQHESSTGDPDAMRRDVESTRAELSRDVDALTDRIMPSRVVGRRVDRVKSTVGSARERFMGSSTSGGATGAVGSMASSASETTSATVASTRSAAQGNPLAAGLIAFGIGWLVSSTIPATRAERDTAAALKSQAEEHSEALTAPLKDAAGEATANLSDAAKEAAGAVKEKATEAASEVQQQAAPK